MTRTLVLADVHGNLAGLEAVLRAAAAEGYDDAVCLGDLALFGPEPAACIDRLRGLGETLRLVQGNTDRYLATGVDDDEVRFCAERIGAERVAFLGGLPTSQRIESVDALCVHASPRSDEERLQADDAATYDAALDGVAARRLLHGHTHVQYRHVHGGIEIVNPGSVGLPFDGDTRAAWAFATADGIDLRRTEYDHEAVARAVEASGSPSRAMIAGRLRTARS
jgi:putative phosphoesterase